MGRRSKLTDKQWSEIERLHLSGESFRSLAKKFGIAESSIRGKISENCAEIKDVANQILVTEARLKSLPISAQIAAQSLADDLRAISHNIASAAKYGSMTSRRLATIANMQVDKIDEVDPMETQEVLQSISALTKMANDASQMGISLLNANKEATKDVTQGNDYDMPKAPVYKIVHE